jgi:predicted aldo/keto reductase-like oxidoreductase
VLEVALDMGINYIDTAEHYGNGQSERTIGEALRNRDRRSIFLTTKLNLSIGAATKDDIERRIRQCLERLKTDYVDCLMIHMTPRVEEVRNEGFHAAVEELKAEGKVRFTGLSNHGIQHSLAGRIEHPMEDVIGAAAADGRFDMTLFAYNFLQKEQGERIIEACKGRDMGVTLMKTNPVSFAAAVSGYLESAQRRGQEIPEAVEKMAREYQSWAEAADEFKERHGLQSEAEVRDAAIKFVLDHPGVHSVCPTINTFDALEAFVALSGQKLSDTESSVLGSYAALMGRYYCRHACGICEPACPRQVPVNTIMRYNHYFEAQGREKQAMEKYAGLTTARAERCWDCSGPCESACPYGVPVQALLARAHRNLKLA